MDKNVEISLLLSFYSNMLTSKQTEAVNLYYNEDLSLSEISENIGITRQGVRDSIKRAETALYDIEERLGIMNKFLRIKSRLSDVDDIIENIERELDASTACGVFKMLENIRIILKDITETY